MAFKVTRGGFDGNFRSGPGGDFTTRGKQLDSLRRSDPFLIQGIFRFAYGVATRSTPFLLGALHDFARRPLPPGKPDADGYLTWREANNWYRHGKGQPLTVDLCKINLKGIKAADFRNKKEECFNLLFRLIGFKNHSINDGLVYGTITLRYLGNGRVKAVKNDIYNFDPKPWYGNTIRNIETIIGGWNAEVGQGYKIHFRGEGIISK